MTLAVMILIRFVITNAMTHAKNIVNIASILPAPAVESLATVIYNETH